MRLRRVHFAEVGHRDARLAPLTLDFGAADSVLWLRNGGGKSSILSLFYAVFLPSMRDFLGKRAEAGHRRLTQYVGPDDLATIVTEWERPGARRLLVARALAWPQRRVSDASRLESLFFAMDADEATDLQHLPLQGLAGGCRSLAELRGWLRDLQARRPELQIQWQEQPGAWRKHLEGLGLDPELFRYQLQMNEREGAADEQFRFGSAEAFVDFLLDLVFDAERAHQVSASLGEMRHQLARKPEKVLEHVFVCEAVLRLEPLCTALGHHAEATARQEAARSAALALASGLLASTRELRSRALALGPEIDGATTRRKAAGNERDKQRRFARGLERRIAELELARAVSEREAAQQRVEDARLQMREVRAARSHAELVRLRQLADALERQLAEHQVRREPALLSLGRAGEVLARALGREIAAAAERTTALAQAYGWAQERVVEGTKSRTEHVARRRELEQARRHLRDRLRARDQAREQLRADGIVEEREAASAGITRLAQAVADGVRDASAATAEEETASAEAQTLQQDADRRRSEARAHAETDRALRQKLADVDAERSELASHPRVRELTEVDEADVLHAGLATRLREAASAQRRIGLKRAVDGAEDQRALETIEATGLLPPSRDVERVIDALSERGIRAVSGPRYLAETEPAPERRARLVRDPVRFGGVIVQRSDALAVAETLGGLGLRTPVVVALPRRDGIAPSEIVALPGDAGQWDPESAAADRTRLQVGVDRLERELSAASAAEHALVGVADRVARFVDQWGGGRLGQLVERQQAAAAQAAQLGVLAEELAAAAGVAVVRARHARTAAERARDGVRGSELGLVRLRSFVRDHEDALEAHRDELDRVSAELDRIPVALDVLDAELARAEADREHAHEALVASRHEREQLAREQSEVAYRDALAPDEQAPLDTARLAYRTRRDTFEREFGHDRLQGQLDQVLAQREQAERAFRQASVGLDPARIVAIADPEAAERLAEAAVGDARAALGQAEERVRHGQAAVAAFEGRRTDDDLPPGPPPPTVEEARARRAECEVAAEQAAADEVSAGLQLDAVLLESAELDRRAGVHADQAQRLVDVVGPPTGRPADVPAADTALRVRVGEVLEQLRRATADTDQAERGVLAGCDRVAAVANDERFAAHRSAIKTRLREDRDELRSRAADYLGSLVERAAVLQADLLQLDTHRTRLVESLALVGDEALGVLRRATRVSELPAAMKEWAGQPFLKIETRPPSTPAERDARLGGLVDRLSVRAEVPDGIELAKLAVRELCGDTLSVSILKPDTVLRPDRVPIVAMSTFSRGQQLTAAIVLYCTLAQLRARSRGRVGRDTDAGVLVLDNPIGTCSSVVLLELQRLVATALRVQLVYTTGVHDLHALDVFPNKIRLRNEHRDRKSGDLHVTTEAALEGVRIRTIEA